MAAIRRSLDVIKQYSVFEKNQVLTHEQLNSIADYQDDQSRLTRLNLLGVGIVCGLQVARQGDSVTVSPGVGLTTDGDLLQLDRTVYDRFRAYDATRPAYAPLYRDGIVPGSMLPVYELVATTEGGDQRTGPLADFTARTGADFDDMVAVLFMESYITDRDLCTGTDCDNLGQDCVHTIRLLLLAKSLAAPLLTKITTPHAAFGQLAEVVAARPLFSASTGTPHLLAQAYRTACAMIHDKLTPELTKLHRTCAPFIGDLFPTGDPAVAWIGRLTKWQAHFATADFGIQYYYDFLKDLVETWNALRDHLALERTWCCPDRLAFPKHLLLGSLTAGADPGDYRTGFYPSPLASRTMEHLDQARFLAGKIDTLIRTFDLPAPQGASVRITPSYYEEQPLEQRAIPYYYQVNTTDPIQEYWNYRLRQLGMATVNYSYNAGLYGATGAAGDPLAAQIGRFSFFRIEGHLGQPVAAMVQVLEQQIKAYNLPIAVRPVMLGADRTKVVKRPGIRYTDLHRFHYLLRQDASHQLTEVARFSQNFKQKVNKAVKDKVIVDTPDDAGVTYQSYARDQNAAVTRGAAKVRAVLNRNYSEYAADTTWKQNVVPTVQAAGLFKSRLGEVVKTEFSTPFDSLLGHDRLQWLDWFDDIIKAKDAQEDEKLLFAAFLAHHPGIEHAAGVRRGGTFILVHDEHQTVVADFMLPYYCCDLIEAEPQQPPMKKPGLRPDWVVGKSITLLPSRHEFFKGKLDAFKTNQLEGILKNTLDSFKNEHVDTLKERIEGGFNAKVEVLQKEYLATMKDSVNLLGNALITRKEQAVNIDKERIPFADQALAEKVSDAKEKEVAARYLRAKAAQSDLSEAERAAYRQQAKAAESDLAMAITNATQYIADSKTEVSAGSDGMTALLTLNNGMQTISDEQAVATLHNRFNAIKQGTTNAGLVMMLDSMNAQRLK